MVKKRREPEVIGWTSTRRGNHEERVEHYVDTDGRHHLAVYVFDGKWRVRIELAPQSGRLVVAELHVEPQDKGQRELGLLARVPMAGITSRFLQRIRVQASAQAITDKLRSPHESERLEYVTLVVATGAEHLLGTLRPEPGAPGPRRGRPPIATARLLDAATAYAAAAKHGSEQPVVEAAAALGLEVGRVRDLVHRARRRGLLTPAQWGQSGGGLTPAALALLGKGKGKRRKKGAKR